MAAPTNTYCDYATGNDYKGASFTDGAYTSATKTLVKTGAFAASQVNHWLYLSDNGSGNIVDGYYKIATWTDANTVILATDAGGGSDATDVVCTQAAGTTGSPWRSIQGALDLITRDATNGDQVNIISATTQVLGGSLITAGRYGAGTASAPIIIRGCTSIANDGGVASIDCAGYGMWATSSSFDYGILADLNIYNFGNNHGIDVSGAGHAIIYHCEIHKGASSPSGKRLINGYNHRTIVINCYIHDAGTSGVGIHYCAPVYNNYIYNCPTGISLCSAIVRNIITDCATTISGAYDLCVENTIYHSSSSTGSGIIASGFSTILLNNIIVGFSGAGGKGISAASDCGIEGFNAFYNNATNKSIVELFVDAGSDVTLSASPFTNAAGGDFSLNPAVVGAIDGAFPGAWYGPASTTDHADIGAVQNGAGTGGGLLRHPGMSGGIDG